MAEQHTENQTPLGREASDLTRLLARINSFGWGASEGCLIHPNKHALWFEIGVHNSGEEGVACKSIHSIDGVITKDTVLVVRKTEALSPDFEAAAENKEKLTKWLEKRF